MFNCDKVGVEVKKINVDSSIKDDPGVKTLINKYKGKDNISTTNRSTLTFPF